MKKFHSHQTYDDPQFTDDQCGYEEGSPSWVATRKSIGAVREAVALHLCAGRIWRSRSEGATSAEQRYRPEILYVKSDIYVLIGSLSGMLNKRRFRRSGKASDLSPPWLFVAWEDV